MQWIHSFQLFLFDFDGLLVNSEELHYLAYKQMCAGRGVEFNWTFEEYCQLAHYSSEGVKKRIYHENPSLVDQGVTWDVLYNEKKRAIFNLLNEGVIQLMPGVEALLSALKQANIPRCVVTHSSSSLVNIVRSKNPLLNTIPNWITREDYKIPKPDSECYLKAINTLANKSDRVIGFEDTPRGLTALMGTRATAVLICQANYPEIPSLIKRGAFHFTSFEAISDDSKLG